MARQDIFVTLIDDIVGERCTSSSQRGKVRCVTIRVNTDVAGKGEIDFCFDKEKRTVIVKDGLPKDWIRRMTG